MANFKLFEQRDGSSIPRLVAEEHKFSHLRPHINRILNDHDRTCELDEALEGLEARGYYVIGWSSRILTVEED